MTKTEKVRQARSIRAHLARFTDLQESGLREHVKSEWGRNPDYSAFNRLLLAQRELNALIAKLREEGYGQ